MVSFGSNLVKLRDARTMSRKDLAGLLEIPYTTLRNYETDQREPGHKTLIRLSNIFHVSVDSLIDSEYQNMDTIIACNKDLDSIDVTVAHAYHNANLGTQSSVKKLLDVTDANDEELAIEREVASYRTEFQAEAKWTAKSKASKGA